MKPTTSNVFAGYWAVLPSELARWHAARASGQRVLVVDDVPPADAAVGPGAESEQSPRERAMSGLMSGANRGGVVAVLPIVGGLRKRGGYWSLGMEDYAEILQALAGRADVKAIVLAIDSPGGTVDGTRRMGDVVRQVNAVKPVVAFADGMMCSAAYWIGSQAGAIIAEPMARVGSIGVLAVHADFSVMLAEAGIKVTLLKSGERKGEGNPYEPLPDAVKASLEADLGTMHQAFIDTVQAGRPGLKAKEAFSGAAWLVEQAPAGLVDEIGPLTRAVQRAAELVEERNTAAGRARASASTTAAPVVSSAGDVTHSQGNQTEKSSDMSLIASIVAKLGGNKKKQARAFELAAAEPALSADEIVTRVDAEGGAEADAAAAADGKRLAEIRTRFGKDATMQSRAFAILADHPEFGAEQIAAQMAQEDAAELKRLREDNVKLQRERDAEKARAEQLASAGLASPVNTGAGSNAGANPGFGRNAEQPEATGINRVAAAFAKDPRNPANAIRN